MFKNYFTIAWRNISQNKGYTLINIAGLAIGMAVFIVALLYVNYETGYDKWDKKLERVYRVGVSETKEGEKNDNFWTSYSLGNRMSNVCPEVETVTRMREMPELNLALGENRFYEKQAISVDSAFFTVFPYKFIYGSAKTALDKPGQAVITMALSKKFFGNQDPVGKPIEIVTTGAENRTVIVSGVVEKTGPSHINFNICLSYFKTGAENWGARVFTTYVLVKPNSSVALLKKKTTDIYVANEAAYQYKELAERDKNISAPGTNPAQWLSTTQKTSNLEIFFEEASAIHLSPKSAGWRDAAANHPVMDSEAGNNIPVIVFSIAALLVLLLACINYTNLSIARAGKRAKESGMRKVMGAGRSQLVLQFLSEAFLQVLASLLLGLILAVWMIGFINAAFSMQLQIWNELDMQENIFLIVQLVCIVLLVTVFSGAYPAFILSSFRPAKVLKGDISKNIKGKLLRNSLVVLQFTISACFIIGLIVVSLQLKHMRNNDPGFATSQVLVLKPTNNAIISPQEDEQKLDLIKTQVLQLPGVEMVSVSDSYPGMPTTNVQEAEFNGSIAEMSFEYIHFDYFSLLSMPLIEGRDFSPVYAMDTVNNAVINEAAARKLGVKNALGQKINILARDYTVIGVLKDNLTAGYNTEVPPTIYAIGTKRGLMGGYRSMLVKIKPGYAETTAAAVERYWKTQEPKFPLRYSWLDQEFAKLIAKYEQFGKITGMIAVVSLLIALMGIFALSAFTAAQRTKEIGVRKVFGASVMTITSLLSKDFLKLVIIALVIAIPLGWWGMNKWLQDFAYRIHISWLVFAITAVLMMMIALVTVSFQTIKAAIANPVKSLRNE